ncbi:hypothetical protein LXL04_038915 [Taraxacum kok-saghyz]
MIKHCGGPAVVRRWSGGGPAVVHQWSNVPMGAGGAPTVVRRWSGGGPVVGAGGGPVGPAVVRWWVQVVVRVLNDSAEVLGVRRTERKSAEQPSAES